MNDIDINPSVAATASKKFSQAASELNRATQAVAGTTRTNVNGQSLAQSTMQRLGATGKQLSDVLAKDGNNIHSVAEGFLEIDQQIAKGKGSKALAMLDGNF